MLVQNSKTFCLRQIYKNSRIPDGAIVTCTEQLGAGAEAKIFYGYVSDTRVSNPVAVKIFIQPDNHDYFSSTCAILNKRSVLYEQLSFVGLPTHRVLDLHDDKCLGYAAPIVPHSEALTTITANSSSTSIEVSLVLQLAATMAVAVEMVHEARVIVGDVSLANFMISYDSPSAPKLSMIDAGAYQYYAGWDEISAGTGHSPITSSPSLRACFVENTEKYADQAGRLKANSRVRRVNEDDAYALIVCTFMLLSCGLHPFQCNKIYSDAPTRDLAQNQAEFIFPYALTPLPRSCCPHAAEIYRALPTPIRDLMQATFEGLAQPSARHWYEVLLAHGEFGSNTLPLSNLAF